MTTPSTLSARRLAMDIERGDLTPTDAVDAVYERIERTTESINAFVHVREAEARAEAKAATQAVQSGEPLGRLHGVPIALKDLDSTIEGMPCTYGSAVFAESVADETSVIVQRLLDEGAIVVGSTNSPEFGHAADTSNPLHGTTTNPFDPSKTAGGSSGGSAAAVAAGIVSIALGSDAAGSIRIPASACGVYGLKPTAGIVPEASRPDALEGSAPFMALGGLTRTVADTALLLEIITGVHSRDPVSMPPDGSAYLSATRQPIESLSVAYSPDFGLFEVEPAVEKRVDEVAETLRAGGATVERVDPEFPVSFEDMRDAETLLFESTLASTAETLKQNEGIDLLGEHRESVTPTLVDLLENGSDHSAVAFKQADVVRTQVYDAIQDVLDEYDLLLTPTLACPPFEAGQVGPSSIDGTSIDPYLDWVLTWPLNLSGHPAASVPAGLSENGLPIGAQLIASRFDEETILSASAAIERRQPWQDTYPSW
ncbi:amidase [Natrialba sp. SSL1]|uniref:amidase n=1 Tax=Natrialba sp. SSL1 TaxID=1869245 RepID=UPI0008F7ED8F|nr:amidase family protein [Natrialba sp. SSL1]OIB56071.1 glutamyl-tRNA amidotransferase [Natrialba sp. SSL1]